MKGNLIVIEGSDASGKATQAKLLLKALRKRRRKALLYSFPRYNEFFGSLVGKYLAGSFGRKETLAPEFASLLYTLDRYSAKNKMQGQLKKGTTLVLDRYYQCNLAYQSAKYKTMKEQEEMIKWISSAESRLPQPDAVVFLEMPVEAAQQLMKGKDRKKAYRNGKKKDQHEADKAYLNSVLQIFKRLARRNNWLWIKCARRKGRKWQVKTREEVHREILNQLRKKRLL